MDEDGQSREECVAQAPLSDLALIAALDWEADEATQAHLQACPHCARRLQRLRRVQQHLRARLYRLFCPSSDLLVEYRQGLLDMDRRIAIARHIAGCPHCAAELELLEADDEALEGIIGKPGRARPARFVG